MSEGSDREILAIWLIAVSFIGGTFGSAINVVESVKNRKLGPRDRVGSGSIIPAPIRVLITGSLLAALLTPLFPDHPMVSSLTLGFCACLLLASQGLATAYFNTNNRYGFVPSVNSVLNCLTCLIVLLFQPSSLGSVQVLQVGQLGIALVLSTSLADSTSNWFSEQQKTIDTIRHGSLRESSIYAALSVSFLIGSLPLVDSIVASRIRGGLAAELFLVTRVPLAVSSLFAATIAPQALNSFIDSMTSGGTDVRAQISRIQRRSMKLFLPVTVGLWLVGLLVGRLFRIDNLINVSQTEFVLTFSLSCSLMVWTLIMIPGIQACWAHSRDRELVALAAVMFLVNVALDILFSRTFGLSGIPLTSLVVYALGSVITRSRFSKRQ